LLPPAFIRTGRTLSQLSSGDRSARLRVDVGRSGEVDRFDPTSAPEDMLAPALVLQHASAIWADASARREPDFVRLVEVPSPRDRAQEPWYGETRGQIVTLSSSWNTDFREGLARLQRAPWAQWSQLQRRAFLMAHQAMLHEAFHAASVGSAARLTPADRVLEDALAELASFARGREFFHDVHGFDPGSDFVRFMTVRAHASDSALDSYARAARTLQLVLQNLQQSQGADVGELARRLGHDVNRDQRWLTLSGWLETARGGPSKPSDTTVRDLMAVVEDADRDAYLRLGDRYSFLPPVSRLPPKSPS